MTSEQHSPSPDVLDDTLSLANPIEGSPFEVGMLFSLTVDTAESATVSSCGVTLDLLSARRLFEEVAAPAGSIMEGKSDAGGFEEDRRDKVAVKFDREEFGIANCCKGSGSTMGVAVWEEPEVEVGRFCGLML